LEIITMFFDANTEELIMNAFLYSHSKKEIIHGSTLNS
jgi:hypothetical protein